MKILVVEDENALREVIVRSLEKEQYVVESASSFREASLKINDYDYDCIVLDIMLPGGSGLTLLKELRALRKKDSIIIISAKDSIEDKVTGLDLGADDYLTKPFGVMELIARVRALLRRIGDGKDEKKVLSLDELSMDDEKHAVYVNDKPCELTFKEYELLKMFLDNVGIVLTRESIMNRIWGTDYSGETRTVDMHIKTLRQKLGEAGNRIKTIRNVGYMLE